MAASASTHLRLSTAQTPTNPTAQHHAVPQHQTPRTPSSKPRAGRKRWALNFGSKTGSLKSVGRASGGGGSASKQRPQDDSGLGMLGSSAGGGSKNSSGFGPLMLATLHGLTRYCNCMM